MMGCLVGLVLTAGTLAFHAMATVMIWLFIDKIQKSNAGQSGTTGDWIVLEEMLVIFITGFALALLHIVDAMIWSISYIIFGAISSLPGAVEFSLDRMTTLGAAKDLLPSRWTMAGPLEAADGMLLFGISTAFLFSVMIHLWSTRGPGVTDPPRT